ncbi:MAG: hypothetical protein L0229_14950 [Blastocatellia bacterium]|nr:hypothetical protein [Blastocatellia bacterium]
MKRNFVKTCLSGLLAALFLGGLPIFTSQVSGGDSQVAFAQRSRSRTTTNTSIIAIGTELKVRLNDTLSSDDSRVGDRFTATVLSPNRYDGARVAGHISSIEKSGRVKGRTTMTLAFDSIRLRNGRSGTMRAELISILGEDAEKVDEEGEVKSGSKGKQTLKRGGIGAAAGAVIGGIIGGGKGALAGLIIGGAAGAGSVAIDGSKELKLESGTRMLIRVTRR